MSKTAKIQEAVAFRKNNDPESAFRILRALYDENPKDPDVNYQMAWTYDFAGKESDAAPFYEAALSNGLKQDREGAFLGLGSTYRCLGEYEKSKKVFDQAVVEFPDNRALKVFRALTCYNLGLHAESTGALLMELLDTTSDSKIKTYDRALRFYADKLDEVWK